MSEMQKGRNGQGGKDLLKSAKTALVLSLVSSLLCIAAFSSLVEAKSKFKIEIDICCVGSDSGTAKIKVKLPDGTSTSKKVDLAHLAEAQDWDNVAVFIKLKNRYESFRVCISGHGCQWGEADVPVPFKGFS